MENTIKYISRLLQSFFALEMSLLPFIALTVTTPAGSHIVVPGTADIYLAGQSPGTCLINPPFVIPSEVDCVPAQGAVNAGIAVIPESVLQFMVSGMTNNGGSPIAQWPTPDGGNFQGVIFFGTTDPLGLSRIRSVINCLVGVFLTDAPPNPGAQPPMPDFVDGFPGTFSSQSLNPQLQQVFFIGDGLTGTGSGDRQKFIVPQVATRLFLGSLDAEGTNQSNQGSFVVQIEITEIPVQIDIKPGSDPNSINPRSKGIIPVAILTTDNFDATTVDPLSVEFGPNGALEAHNKGPIEDADGDGDMDMVLHFKTQDTRIQCSNTEASLTGKTVGGQGIRGADAIQTVGCGSAKAMAGAEAGIPAGYALLQNYPNPFSSEAKSSFAGNPETEIRFQLPEASQVGVKIFNTVGKEIRTLVDAPYQVGYHRVRWDGKDKNGSLVASGVYLYQLRAGNFSQVRKMSLLR